MTPSHARRPRSVTWRIALLATAMVVLAISGTLLLEHWLAEPLLAGAIGLV